MREITTNSIVCDGPERRAGHVQGEQKARRRR